MTSLVIPVAVEPVNPVLDLTLDSVERYAPWLNPVLVGEPIQLLEYTDRHPGVNTLEFRTQQDGKPLENTTAMLRAACLSPLVTDPFVWSNDDIVFVKQVDLDDIMLEAATALPAERGRLDTDQRNMFYANAKRATAELLLSWDRPIWDYERHVPLVIHKLEMLRLLQHIELYGIPLIAPRSLYQNYRLEKPAAKDDDVKIFFLEERLTVQARGGAFISTADPFPIPILREVLGL